MQVRTASVRAWAREKKDDPVFWSDAIQLVKTTAAAVIAWVLATSVACNLPQSFLAPWSALLVVHATVYRTFSEGAAPGQRRRVRRPCSPGRSATPWVWT